MEDDQNIWNFIFTLLFIGMVVFCIGVLLRAGRLPIAIDLFDLVLIILATLRLIRLFVYDKITRWFRDLFMQKTTVEGSPGESITIRQKYAGGPLRTLSELFACPWCIGVWASFTVTFFYFLTPLAWFPILFLAIAGVATFLQLLSNMIGWRAELLKLETQELERE